MDSTATEQAFLCTWYEAVAVEPRLHVLEQLVESLRCRESHPEYWRRYEGWKRQLRSLTGFNARKPELRTIAAYDACHWYLLQTFERGAK